MVGQRQTGFAENLLEARFKEFELQPEFPMMLGRNPTEGTEMAGGMTRYLLALHARLPTHTHTQEW